MKKLHYIGLTTLVLLLFGLFSCKNDEPRSKDSHSNVPSGKVELDLSFGIGTPDLPDLRHMPIEIQEDGIPLLDPNNLFDGQKIRATLYIMRINKSVAEGGTGGNPTQDYLTILKDINLVLKKPAGEPPRLVFHEIADVIGFVSKEDARRYDWYICSFIGGEWVNGKQTYQPFKETALSMHNAGDKGTIEVPYGFAWKKFDFDNPSAFVPEANFSPMGYFFRFKIANNSDADYRVNSITFESTSLFSHASFDPISGLQRGDFEHSRARWINASESTSWTITPPDGQILNIQPHQTAQYGYVWFASDKVHWMVSDPRIDSQMVNSLNITLSGVGIKAPSRFSYTTNIKPQSASAIYNSSPLRTLKIKGSTEDLVHPMYYMGRGVERYGDVAYLVNSSTPAVEMDTEQQSGGVFPSSEFVTINPGDRTVTAGDDNLQWSVVPNNRYLPTLLDWMTLLPVSRRGDTQQVIAWEHAGVNFEAYRWFGRESGNDLNISRSGNTAEWVSLRTSQGGAIRFYTANAQYYAKGIGGGNTTMVALRFVDGGTTTEEPKITVGNRFRSYWRYTLIPTSNLLRIDIVQIGEGAVEPVLGQPVTLDVLKNNPDYFVKAAAQGRMVTHYLPFGGHPNGANETITGRYLASSTIDGNYCGILITKNGFFTHYLKDINGATTAKVRYFKTDPLGE